MEKRLRMIERAKELPACNEDFKIVKLYEDDFDWLISTVKKQQEEIEKANNVLGARKNLVKCEQRFQQAKVTIEKYKTAIEQSLRNFDHGNRLDGLLALKEVIEGEEQ